MAKRINVKFGDFKKAKKLGKFSDDGGIGASLYEVDCEVVKAEYAVDKDKKQIKSPKGNRLVDLNCKINDGKNDMYFNVKYYETDFSPKLKEVTPTDAIKKFVRINLSNGGDGFGSISIENYKTDEGQYKSVIKLFGANVNKAIKQEDGTYMIKIQDGSYTFEASKNLQISAKGFIEEIADIDQYMTDNYTESTNTLKLDLYCFEGGNKPLPIAFEGLETDRAERLLAMLKEQGSKAIGIRGTVKKCFSKSKVVKEANNEFETINDTIDITTYISVNMKENGSYYFKLLNNEGSLNITFTGEDDKKMATEKNVKKISTKEVEESEENQTEDDSFDF